MASPPFVDATATVRLPSPETYIVLYLSKRSSDIAACTPGTVMSSKANIAPCILGCQVLR